MQTDCFLRRANEALEGLPSTWPGSKSVQGCVLPQPTSSSPLRSIISLWGQTSSWKEACGGPSSPRAGQMGSGAQSTYLHRDDVPSPEVDVDGVQWGGQRHPLPLAVDGRYEGCRRWEAAKGLHWYLEGDVMSQRVLGSAKTLCCCWEARAETGPHSGDRA